MARFARKMGTAAEQRKSILLKATDFSKLSFMGINEDEVIGKGVDDMTKIDVLSEQTILKNLEVRYRQDKIYVSFHRGEGIGVKDGWEGRRVKGEERVKEGASEKLLLDRSEVKRAQKRVEVSFGYKNLTFPFLDRHRSDRNLHQSFQTHPGSRPTFDPFVQRRNRRSPTASLRPCATSVL